MKGAIDSGEMYLIKDDKVILTVSLVNGVYAIESMTLNGKLDTTLSCQQNHVPSIINVDSAIEDDSEDC